MFLNFCFNFAVFCQIGATLSLEAYFWRDYSSKIPRDAISGGLDINGHDTYIGQSYVHNLGLFVMQIFPGQEESLAAYGVKKPSGVKKILCSPYPSHFYWMTTSAKSFHLDSTGKHAVIGGFDHLDANKGMLHVGRLTYEGEIKIGYIAGYALENAKMNFIGRNTEKSATSYEALMFNIEGLQSPVCTSNPNNTICVY